MWKNRKKKVLHTYSAAYAFGEKLHLRSSKHKRGKTIAIKRIYSNGVDNLNRYDITTHEFDSNGEDEFKTHGSRMCYTQTDWHRNTWTELNKACKEINGLIASQSFPKRNRTIFRGWVLFILILFLRRLRFPTTQLQIVFNFNCANRFLLHALRGKMAKCMFHWSLSHCENGIEHENRFQIIDGIQL